MDGLIIPRGDPGGGKRQWGVEGCLETQKRAERQRVVLKENLGDLKHTPEEAIAPGERKTAAQAQHPRKQGDHNHGRETIEHFILGKGRDRKVCDRDGGLE